MAKSHLTLTISVLGLVAPPSPFPRIIPIGVWCPCRFRINRLSSPPSSSLFELEIVVRFATYSKKIKTPLQRPKLLKMSWEQLDIASIFIPQIYVFIIRNFKIFIFFTKDHIIEFYTPTAVHILKLTWTSQTMITGFFPSSHKIGTGHFE